MIIYKIKNNTVIATFDERDWDYSIFKYFDDRLSTDTRVISDVVFSIVDKLRKSGMRFYGEAKCSPEDTFNEKTGKRLAKKRLLAKYNRVLSMVDKELINILNDDVDFMFKYVEVHKERGQHR